jgi:tRNA A37 threonylcarbamoyladenosine dehydratase
MIRPDMLIIGLGGVGSWALELLIRTIRCRLEPLRFDDCDARAQELIARLQIPANQ